MKNTVFGLTLISLLLATHAFAGDCVMSITREACPGKDTDSYAKCGGKQSCDETKKTGSAEACAKEAAKACQNKRLDVTKSKTIVAKFNGQSVEGGKDFCKDKTDGIFDPTKDFPYRGKSDCK